MCTIISFVSSIEILKEFCIENYSFFSLRVEIKLFFMWILFIFRENVFWFDVLREAKICMTFLIILKMEDQLRNITFCDECNSDYYTDISQMENLCPECSYILYGCQNCNHDFEWTMPEMLLEWQCLGLYTESKRQELK